ncbi:MAG: zinc ribbon domain-containing protein [Thermoplasmata archaeon]
MSGPSPTATAPPPPPAPASATTACPKCGQPIPKGSRFCNACGASIAPPPAAPATPPVDLRERVDQDRGILKRLQLLVPGYSGYRQATDLQAADSLLRRQVADKVRNARTTLENARTALTNANQFSVLTDLAPLLSDLQRLEGEIRHGEQGYTGISPAVRINPQQLDRLYEYDYGFALAADQLDQTVAPLPTMTMAGGASGVPPLLSTARGQVTQLEQAFKARLQAIEGIRVP